MSYRMQKPAWFGKVGRANVVSPAAVVEVGDWWDAWRLAWWAIGVAVEQGATLWTRKEYCNGCDYVIGDCRCPDE